MREFIEWLEEDSKRLRKVIAIYTAIIWAICTAASFALLTFGHDVLALYSLVTAQFTAVVGFYMSTKAQND